MRPLSYLTDDVLDRLLSAALAIARRLGCLGYDRLMCWHGPWLPHVLSEVLWEYKVRNSRGRR